MSTIDWTVFLVFLAYVVWDGLRRARGTKTLEGYFAGGRSISWWAAGLSIMATQASAITVIGTTGQGHESGMEFVQMYFGLAFAMVLLCIFFVPLYKSRPILTAYEYLEHRFGPATRTLASLIFLISRCLAFGVVLYAPGVVLAAVLELDVVFTVLFVGALTTLYTMFGGIRAVIATDVKQMLVILGGLFLCLGILLCEVVPETGWLGMLHILGAGDKLNAVELRPESLDFLPKFAWEDAAAVGKSFWEDKYNFWSGLLGGLFLMLSYFGCDQSQVQRILTNPSVRESRLALLLSAFAKVPMQAMVLFIGVLLYLFFVLNGSPLLFNPSDREAASAESFRPQVAAIEQRHERAQERRRQLALEIATQPHGARENATLLSGYQESIQEVADLRQEARGLIHENKTDTNYIFPHFILNHIPVVCLGLMMAAIFAAMMSSADSALNSLTSSTIVDIYKRWFRPDASESESLLASRLTTLFWGASATGAALLFRGTGSVIEVVNMVGSFFYGSLLGVFVLGLVLRRAGPLAGFLGLAGGMLAVLAVHFTLRVEFLWYNVIGCVVVLVVGGLVSLLQGSRKVS